MERASDRRAHPRYAVDLDARVRFPAHGMHRLRIRNLCTGGALVDSGADACPQDLEPGQRCEIEFSLPGAGGERALRMEGEVAHRVESGFGARFLRAGAEALGALQGFVRERARRADAGRARTFSGAAPDADTARSLLEKVTLLRLDPLVDALLERMQTELWAYSDGLKSDAERGRVVNDLAALAAAHRERRLHEHLRRALLDLMRRRGGKAGALPPASPAGELALVDTDRFEVWLARSAMSNRIEERLADSLRLLRSQAATVFGSESMLPVEPQGLADALGGALESAGLGAETQGLSLRIAGDILPPLLEPVYGELIRAWEDAGLRPADATQAPRTPAPAVRRQVAVAQVPRSGETAAVPLASAGVAEVLDRLPPDALAGWQGQDLPLGRRVLDLVHRAAPESAGQPPERRLEERVEATGKVLHKMLEDPAVPEPLRGWVERLALRFLAAAVAEPAFFGPGAHPLRTLVDRLEHLTQFLMPGEERVRQELEALLAQTLDAGGSDPQVLEAAAERVAGLERQYGARFRRNAARVVTGLEGRERVREAQRVVRERLNRSLVGRRVHRSLDVLVRDAWQALLQLVHVREGSAGPGWQYHWETLERLGAACCQAPDREPVSDLPGLLGRVEEGLAYVGFDPFHSEQLLEETGRALRAISAGTDAAEDYGEFVPLPPVTGERRDREPPEGIPAPDWEEALARTDRLELGSLLQFRGEPEEAVLRLVWKSGGGEELVCVNPRGLKARTLAREALAQALYRGDASARPPARETVTGRARDATLQEMQARISYHDTHDTLTGLSNRRQLMDTLVQGLAAETGTFRRQVLGFVELDHYEAVNGTCGYLAGEKMLVAVAKLLENTLEEADCLAYLGGSRFGLLVPAADGAQGEEVGERVRSGMDALPFYWHGTPYPVAGSVGLALVEPGCDNPETLLSAADAACQAARRAGGNRVVLFREGDERIARQRERMQWWVRAERAVKAERLRLRAQRIAPADAADPALSHHHEILLSVYDEAGAPLPLGDFIASAEAFNMMAEVDRLVIAKALSWVSDHFGQIEVLGGIAINLSGQSLGDDSLVELVRDQLRRFAVPPGFVSFEVTETTAIANLDRAVAIVEGIKALGCRFALDDFGTGMSSYSYLKRLPVDFLKIDGSFVKEILKHPHDQAIVKSINEIAHFMGKRTIAEYVESDGIADRLREMGVDYLQGYAVEKGRFLDEMR